MAEAYVPQSRLLAELMARRHNPVQSIGQGLADVAGDVGEAYFIKKAAEKEAEKKQGDAGDMAAMLARAMNPQMNALDASVAQGGTPAQQAFPQGQTSAAQMLAGAMGTRAQPAFSPEMMKPLDPAQRASAAMQRTAVTNPEVASAGLPMALELAQMTAPKRGFTGKLGPNEVAYDDAKQVAANLLPEKSDVLSPEAEAQKIRLAQARPGTEETWNNPVAEVDPNTGKPIQVRYSNRGAREVIANATPARQGNSFDRADYWRGQVKPFADAATNARVQSSKVGSSLALNTGTGHIAAINALQKMIDEGAVVRDQDVELIQSAQSLSSRLSSQIEGLKSGKILSPELQGELKQVASGLENAIYKGVNERIGAYEPVMTEEGVNMDSVLPPKMREMFKEKELGATETVERPSGVPADARKAPDGKWYSPDPLRPGKYVQW